MIEINKYLTKIFTFTKFMHITNITAKKLIKLYFDELLYIKNITNYFIK